MANEEEKKKKVKTKIGLADDLPTPPVNPVYFAMQIAITVILVIIQTLIGIFYLNLPEIPFTVSAWLLGLSIAYFFYRDNEYLYSMILGGFMAVVFVIGSNMASGLFWDFQHIPILLAAIHILTQKREFDFKVVIYGTMFVFCWLWTVWLTGVAYSAVFDLNGMIALSFITLMNLTLFYSFKRKSRENDEKKKRSFSSKSLVQVIIMLAITIALIFLLAGDVFTYWQGMVYTTISIVTILIALAVFLRRVINVEQIVKDIMTLRPDMTRLDKALYFGYIPLFFSVVVLASLDGGRFHWTTEVPVLIYFFGCIGLGFSNFLKRWAIISHNEFIGPYRVIRHPGYLSGIIGVISTAIVLGSLWSLIPAGCAAVFLIILAYKDDRSLAKRSTDYANYMKKVKYRLIPGIF